MNRVNETLKRGAHFAAAWVPDVLMVVGAISVAYGAGMIYTPAGFIAGGTMAIASGVLAARGAR